MWPLQQRLDTLKPAHSDVQTCLTCLFHDTMRRMWHSLPGTSLIKDNVRPMTTLSGHDWYLQAVPAVAMFHEAKDEDRRDLYLLLELTLVLALTVLMSLLRKDVRVQARCCRGFLLTLCTLQTTARVHQGSAAPDTYLYKTLLEHPA